MLSQLRRVGAVVVLAISSLAFWPKMESYLINHVVRELNYWLRRLSAGCVE